MVVYSRGTVGGRGRLSAVPRTVLGGRFFCCGRSGGTSADFPEGHFGGGGGDQRISDPEAMVFIVVARPLYILSMAHALRLCSDPGQDPGHYNKPSRCSSKPVVFHFTVVDILHGFKDKGASRVFGWFDAPASKARGESRVCVS